jgi:hypothetical protein
MYSVYVFVISAARLKSTKLVHLSGTNSHGKSVKPDKFNGPISKGYI